MAYFEEDTETHEDGQQLENLSTLNNITSFSVEAIIPTESQVVKNLEKELQEFQIKFSALQRYGLQVTPGKRFGFVYPEKVAKGKGEFLHLSNVIKEVSYQGGLRFQLLGKNEPVFVQANTQSGIVYANPADIESKFDRITNTHKTQLTRAYTQTAYDQFSAAISTMNDEIARTKQELTEQQQNNDIFLKKLKTLTSLPELIQTAVAQGKKTNPRQFVGFNRKDIKPDLEIMVGDETLPLFIQDESWSVEVQEGEALVTRNFKVWMVNPRSEAIISVKARGWTGLALPTTNKAVEIKENSLTFALSAKWDTVVLSNKPPQKITVPAQLGTPQVRDGKITQELSATLPIGIITASQVLYLAGKKNAQPLPLPEASGTDNTPDPVLEEELKNEAEAQKFIKSITEAKNLELWHAPESEPHVTAVSIADRVSSSVYPGGEDFGLLEGTATSVIAQQVALLELTIPGLPPRIISPGRGEYLKIGDLQFFRTLNPEQIKKRVFNALFHEKNQLTSIKNSIPSQSLAFIKERYPKEYSQLERAIEYAKKLETVINETIILLINQEQDLVIVPDGVKLPDNVAFGYTFTEGKDLIDAKLDEQDYQQFPNDYPLDYNLNEIISGVSTVKVTSRVRKVVRKSDLPRDIKPLHQLDTAYVIWNNTPLLQTPQTLADIDPKKLTSEKTTSTTEIIIAAQKLIDELLPAELPDEISKAIVALQACFSINASIKSEKTGSTVAHRPSGLHRHRDDYDTYYTDERVLRFNIIIGDQQSDYYIKGPAIDRLPTRPQESDFFQNVAETTEEITALKNLTELVYLQKVACSRMMHSLATSSSSQLNDELRSKIRNLNEQISQIKPHDYAVYYLEQQMRTTELAQVSTHFNQLIARIRATLTATTNTVQSIEKPYIAENLRINSLYRAFLNQSENELINQFNDVAWRKADTGRARLALAALATKGFSARMKAVEIIETLANFDKNITWNSVQEKLDEEANKAKDAPDYGAISSDVLTGIKGIVLTRCLEMAQQSHSDYLGEEDQAARLQALELFDQELSQIATKNIEELKNITQQTVDFLFNNMVERRFDDLTT